MTRSARTHAERKKPLRPFPKNDFGITINDNPNDIASILDEIVSGVIGVHAVYPYLYSDRYVIPFKIDFWNCDSETHYSVEVTWDWDEAEGDVAFFVTNFSLKVSTEETAPSLPGVSELYEGPLTLWRRKDFDFYCKNCPPITTVEQMQELIRAIASLQIEDLE